MTAWPKSLSLGLQTCCGFGHVDKGSGMKARLAQVKQRIRRRRRKGRGTETSAPATATPGPTVRVVREGKPLTKEEVVSVLDGEPELSESADVARKYATA